MEEYSDEEYLRKKSSGEEFLRRVYKDLAKSDEVRRAVIRYNNQNSDSQVRGGANVEAIQTYLNRQEYILSRIDEERVRQLFYDYYVIKEENVPASYFELQERIALERGEGHVHYTEDMKRQEIEHIINEQKSSLDTWLDYFTSEETSFPTWFKYFCFQGMTRIGYYDKGKDEYTKRTKTTTKPYIELNREAIAMLYDELIKYFNPREITDESLKKLIEGGSFAKLYLYCIKKIDSFDKDQTNSDDGIWKKYNMGSDPKILFNDIHGKGTGWCTAGGIETATSHLNGGDFYVYYTKDRNGSYTQPRIAIKMIGPNISEIRGIGPSQNIEPNMLKVVEEKLKEFPDADAYKKKAHDMEMLTYIYTKFKNNPNCELTIEELNFLYEIDEKISGFYYMITNDSRINEIIESRNKRDDMALIFNVRPDQVSLTKDEVLSGDKIVHYGDLSFDSSIISKNFILPEILIGNLDFLDLTSAEGLKLPKIINGGLYFFDLISAKA